MRKRVLITGVNGFVGKYLTNEFRENGYFIIGLGVEKKNRYYVDEYYSVDILFKDELYETLKVSRPNIIVHLAAQGDTQISWQKPHETISINVLGSLNILDAIRQIDFKITCLMVGSSSVYANSLTPINENSLIDPSSPYAVSKLAQEQLAELYRKQYGIQTILTRSFNHLGIGQSEKSSISSFCKQVAEAKIKKEKTISVGNITVYRDFTDVRDIVKAYRLLCERSDLHGVYNIGSGKAVSLEKILDYLINISKSNIRVFIDPERVRKMDNSYVCCDNSKMQLETGWTPSINIFDTIKEIYDFYYEETLRK